MTKINNNYQRLPENYLFSAIRQRTETYQAAHPDRPLIKLSIGDVTRPLPAVVVTAMQEASRELGASATFRGYGPETGYPWLKQAIVDYYRRTKQVVIAPEEIIVSDGAKCDVANILDIFDQNCTVAMCDPVYPVYLESNLMQGRQPHFFYATPENNFLPLPDAQCRVDLIYLCNPHNPTGAAYTREQLQQWVDFANQHQAIILYDAAYESFITTPDLPSSIWQIPGARTCAVEIASLSKTAGFTGVRCSYTIVPRELRRQGVSLLTLWTRRQTAKFNGVSYVVQRGAAAVFTEAGQRAVQRNLTYYQRNTTLLRTTLQQLGWQYSGGIDSPYVWVACPAGQTAWEFFDELLDTTGIVCTPGVGFGRGGQNYVRLTGFGSYLDTKKACQMLIKNYWSLKSK